MIDRRQNSAADVAIQRTAGMGHLESTIRKSRSARAAMCISTERILENSKKA